MTRRPRPISLAQARAARALLGWTQADLALRAKVAKSTVADFERGARDPIPANRKAIRAALEAGGVVFFRLGVKLRPFADRIIADRLTNT